MIVRCVTLVLFYMEIGWYIGYLWRWCIKSNLGVMTSDTNVIDLPKWCLLYSPFVQVFACLAKKIRVEHLSQALFSYFFYTLSFSSLHVISIKYVCWKLVFVLSGCLELFVFSRLSPPLITYCLHHRIVTIL